jgi:enoyl-CoA hydratase
MEERPAPGIIRRIALDAPEIGADLGLQVRLDAVQIMLEQDIFRRNGGIGLGFTERPPIKPLIAAVEGPAIAGGTEILQATDIRVAGESAKFGISEAKWSLYPMGGSAVRLVRQIPYTVACELLLTGRHITAAEAKEIGLIGYVVPDGQALTKALEIAEVISNNGPLAVQAILRSIRETEGLPENEAFEIDTQLGIKVFLSDDAKEGPLAFKEKRSPQFKGR